MPTSLPDLLAAARQMVAGLTANPAPGATRGLPTDAAAGQAKIDLLQRLEEEQELLKSTLRSKTAERDTAAADLKDWLSQVSGVVKVSYRGQPEKWGEFGIKAKR